MASKTEPHDHDADIRAQREAAQREWEEGRAEAESYFHKHEDVRTRALAEAQQSAVKFVRAINAALDAARVMRAEHAKFGKVTPMAITDADMRVRLGQRMSAILQTIEGTAPGVRGNLGYLTPGPCVNYTPADDWAEQEHALLVDHLNHVKSKELA